MTPGFSFEILGDDLAQFFKQQVVAGFVVDIMDVYETVITSLSMMKMASFGESFRTSNTP
jgi:hypothetical protein